MPRFVLASAGAAVALLAMIMTSGEGGSSLGIFLFFVPMAFVLGVMGCVVTGVAYVLGLPLVLIPGAKAWWAGRAWLSWLIVAVGVSAFVFSRVIATSEIWYDDEGFSQVDYNSPPVLLFGGILLLTFGLLWVPRRQLPSEPVGLDRTPLDS